MTWIHDRLELSPFLGITSATKRCGKSLLLELLAELVYRPMPVGGRVTSAALFRMIARDAPTMLLDEVDSYLRDDDELRGVVNGSQRRSGAFLVRCVGEDHEPRQFGTWCPKALAGIGDLPDTVRDRAIVVRMERRPPAVHLEHWRDRDRAAVDTMRGQIARWAADRVDAAIARRSRVSFPSVLNDRARDAWEALLAIADESGGGWAGERGRAALAAATIAGRAAKDEGGAVEMLLADLREIFEADGWPDAIASATILERLVAMESRPWCEWRRGKPLSARGLANLLQRLEVVPRNHRFPSGTQSKAYLQDELKPHWIAYFPGRGDFYPSRRPNTGKQGVSCDPYPSQGDRGGTDTDRTKPYKTGIGTAGRIRHG